MAYVPVPKDLTNVKTKLALNLTKRQLIFFTVAGFVGIPFYLLTRRFIGSDIAAIFMITLMLPFFFMAMYEKDGLPFEKVMENYIRLKFINPPIRPYKAKNFYAGIDSLVKESDTADGEENKARAAASPAPNGRNQKPQKKKNKHRRNASRRRHKASSSKR